eukprot:7385419-Prymnesium_polylepis.1
MLACAVARHATATTSGRQRACCFVAASGQGARGGVPAAACRMCAGPRNGECALTLSRPSLAPWLLGQGPIARVRRATRRGLRCLTA